MDRLPVVSSNLASVGYDDQTNTLEVEFQSGSVYQYADVPATVYQELLNAESVGKYFSRVIKTQYEGVKVG